MLWIEYQVNGSRFAIEAKRVEAVLPGRSLASDPAAPPYWGGWMRFRNRTCPVLDLGGWWHGRRTALGPRVRILVMALPAEAGPDRWAGLLVERVSGVIRRNPEDFVSLTVSRASLPVFSRVALDEHGLLSWIPWERQWEECLGKLLQSARQWLSDHSLLGSTSNPGAQGQGQTVPQQEGFWRTVDVQRSRPADPLRGQDCWKLIGSRGQATCPHLETVRYCAACETFRVAADGVLDWFAPEATTGEFEAWLEQSSRPQKGRSEGMVVFGLSGHWWAIWARWVEEVTGALPFHRLALGGDSAVCGLAQWRGALVPCVSLRRLLGWKDPCPRRGTVGPWVMLARDSRGVLALPVDRLAGVQRVRTVDLQWVPMLRSGSPVALACAMFHDRYRCVSVLDWERTLSILEPQWAQKS